MFQGFEPVEVTSLDVACSLGTIGIPCVIHRTVYESDYHEDIAYHMDRVSLENKEWRTAEIIAAHHAGTLHKAHPFEDAMSVLRSRRAFVKMLHEGRACHLAKIIGGDRWEIMPGHGTRCGASELFKTSDIKLAVALQTMGHDLARIEGNGNRAVFYLAARNVDTDAACMPFVNDFRAGVLASNEPTHPLVTRYMALSNYSAFVDATRKAKALIYLRKPNGMRHAYIREDADGACYDRAKQFFAI